MHQLMAISAPVLSSTEWGGGFLQTLGNPTSSPIRQMTLVNISPGRIYLSDDGVNVKWVVLSNQSLTIDFTANSHLPDGELVLPAGIQFYAQSLYAIASFYLTLIYAKGD